MGRGRPILPPMPILMYRNFTDADLEAIFAYLQSIPAIRKQSARASAAFGPVTGWGQGWNRDGPAPEFKSLVSGFRQPPQ
jgi:hypothetical protein